MAAAIYNDVFAGWAGREEGGSVLVRSCGPMTGVTPDSQLGSSDRLAMLGAADGRRGTAPNRSELRSGSSESRTRDDPHVWLAADKRLPTSTTLMGRWENVLG